MPKLPEHKENEIRAALEHAIISLNEGMLGEAWMAARHAMRELEKTIDYE